MERYLIYTGAFRPTKIRFSAMAKMPLLQSSMSGTSNSRSSFRVSIASDAAPYSHEIVRKE